MDAEKWAAYCKKTKDLLLSGGKVNNLVGDLSTHENPFTDYFVACAAFAAFTPPRTSGICKAFSTEESRPKYP